MSKICVTKSLLNVSKDEFLHFRAEVNLAKLLKDKLSLKSFKAVAGSAFRDYSVKLVLHGDLELDKPLHICYRPQRSCGQGNVFTGVCHSFCSQGGVSGEPLWTRENPPRPGRPPGTRENPPRTRENPPRPRRPPRTRENPPWTRQTPQDQGEPPSDQRDPPGPGRPPGPRRPSPDQGDPPGPGRTPPPGKKTAAYGQ